MRTRFQLILGAVAAIVVGASVGVASASDINPSGGVLGVGSGSVDQPTCTAGGLNLVDVRSEFTGNGYRIRVVNVDSVVAACRSKAYSIATADNTSAKPKRGEWAGTLPNAGTATLSPGSAADAANVDDVNSANNQVVLYLLVKG